MKTLSLDDILSEDVRKASNGSIEAYTRLINQCRSLICSIALAIVRDVQASEEVAQEVFLASWCNIKSLRNTASFLPWLRQLTRNRSNDFLRKKLRQNYTTDHDQLLATTVDPGANPLENLLQKEEQLRLTEAIDTLPPDSREVVVLFYREGRSTTQVASLLGMKESAIKKRLSRARQKLRESLLETAGRTIARTAPGTVFTTAIISFLSTAPQGVASVASLGISKSFFTSNLAKVATLFSGLFLGGISAIGGIYLGVRINLARALDEKEKQDLYRFRRTNIFFIVFIMLFWGIFLSIWHSPLASILPFSLFALGMVFFYTIWFPKIIARRLIAEQRSDPNAWKRHRRERFWGFFGLIFGLLAGTTGLLFGILYG